MMPWLDSKHGNLYSVLALKKNQTEDTTKQWFKGHDTQNVIHFLFTARGEPL